MGPKSKKKSKKEIEEEKAAAEAQRKLEEELEVKRLAEEAEKKRIADEKRRIEEEKRRQEELVRLQEQSPQVQERDAQILEKRSMAQQSRVKLLDDKYLECDPLPDPENEKDLTSFICLWREAEDKTIEEAVENCQIGENVVHSINKLLTEAQSQYDYAKIKWCEDYIKQIRDIIQHKYEYISAEVLTYVEKYWSYTEEELEELRNKPGGGKRNADQNQKAEVTLSKASDDIHFGIWMNIQAKSKQGHEKIQFESFATGIPRAHASQHLVIRCMWTSFDYISGPENAKKADELCVGGVVYSRMFQYPALPISGFKWMIRPIQSVQDSLVCIEYPDPQAPVTDPVKCILKLPPYVFTSDSDDIKVGVWDAENQQWTADFIEDLTWDKSKRQLEFATRKFAPIAYLQKKTLDFPYDSWYLRTTKAQQALLTVKTRRGIELNIEINPLNCRLVECEFPELAHIVGKECSAGMLLLELSKCGIHMLPEDEDAARGEIHLKDKAAEERAILDIAQTLKVFAFQSVKWSQTAPAENIVARLRENPDNDRVFLEDDESDWKSIMWWNNKVSYIKCKNCEDKFNATIEDGQVTHAILPLAIVGVQSEDAVEQCSYFHDIDFVDNVQRLLRLMRLLSFTTAAFDKRTLEEQQQ